MQVNWPPSRSHTANSSLLRHGWAWIATVVRAPNSPLPAAQYLRTRLLRTVIVVMLTLGVPLNIVINISLVVASLHHQIPVSVPITQGSTIAAITLIGMLLLRQERLSAALTVIMTISTFAIIIESWLLRQSGAFFFVVLCTSLPLIVFPLQITLVVIALSSLYLVGVFFVPGMYASNWVAVLAGVWAITAGLAALGYGFQRGINEVAATIAAGEADAVARARLEEQNNALSQYAMQAEELATTKERNRLAREIHDGLGHHLTTINMQIEAARAVFESAPLCAQTALEVAQHEALLALTETRRSVAALRISPLDSQTFVEALAELVDTASTDGFEASYSLSGTPRPLNPQTELTLYRTAQEGLTNIHKHAHASQADVQVDFGPTGMVRLVVHDNGIGTSDIGGGFGMLGIRERVDLLDGHVRTQTAPGQGFTLEIEVPG